MAVPGDPDSLEGAIREAQECHEPWLRKHNDLQKEGNIWMDNKGRLAIPSDQELQCRMMHAYHDGLTGHPGRDETAQKIAERFYWPGGRTWIKQYIKGCAICQQNKNLTHHPQMPLFKISVPENASPFTQIVMDLITGLPKS